MNGYKEVEKYSSSVRSWYFQSPDVESPVDFFLVIGGDKA
jgi:hypothetical protein